MFSYVLWLIQGKHIGLSSFAIALNGAVAATCAYAFANSIGKTRRRHAAREIAAVEPREDAHTLARKWMATLRLSSFNLDCNIGF